MHIFKSAISALLAAIVAMVLAAGAAKAEIPPHGESPAPVVGEVACLFCCNNSCNGRAVAELIEDGSVLEALLAALAEVRATESGNADMATTCPPPPATTADAAHDTAAADGVETACLFCCNNSCNGGKTLA